MLPYDKRLHFAVCFLITLLLFPAIKWWGAVAAIMAGVIKELFDFDDYGVFSWGDILADTIGVIAGIILILLIKLII